MRRILFLLLLTPLLWMSYSGFAQAEGKKCPKKVLETKTIEGTLAGVGELPDGYYGIGVDVPGEEETVFIGASTKQMKKFANAIHKKVSATYKVQQYEDCRIEPTLVSGKVLSK